MKQFIKNNFATIVLVLALLSLLKSCGDSRELQKLRKEVEVVKSQSATKEEIEQIDQQIKQEEENGTGGPIQQPGQVPEVSAEQYPPEDNTADNGASESLTPQLDADVEKYSAILNRR